MRAVSVTGGIVAGLMVIGLQSSSGARAEEVTKLGEVVVTATRTREPLDQATTSVTVVDSQDIERHDDAFVGSALFGTPGLDVTQFGSPGQSSFAAIRGAAPDQVLVLLDGVEVNAPTTGQFDFADLTPDNIGRIEVLRGSGGTMHGSGAIGGVVNALSERGDGPWRANVSGEAGRTATNRERLQLVGSQGPFSISGTTSYFGSDGYQPMNDDYRNVTTAWRADLDVLPTATARAFVRYGNVRAGLPNFNVADGVLDPSAYRRDDFLLVKGEWEHELAPALTYRLATSYVQDNPRYNDDGPNPAIPDATAPLVAAHTQTNVTAAEAQANYAWQTWSLSSVGVEVKEQAARVFRTSYLEDPEDEELERETERYDANRTNVAVFGQEQLQLLDNRLRGVGGVRWDKYDGFGDRFTWSGSAGYLFPKTGTRLRLGYAEGFRVPTFDELYEFAGNPNLQPETSWEINGGFTQEFWDGRVRFEPTYFYRHVHNLIEEVVDQLPGPIAPPREEEVQQDLTATNLDARFQGVELIGRAQPLPWLTLNANYTYLNYVTPTGVLVNRPRHRGSVGVAVSRDDVWQSGDQASAALYVFAVGRRDSVDARADYSVQQIGGYARTDLDLRYGFGGDWDAWAITASVRNLFNRDYQESIGFPAPPATFLIGFRYRG